MQNIVRLSPRLILELAEVTTRADNLGKSLRIQTGTDKQGTWIKWDIGQTGWTPPLYGEDW